MKTLFAVDPLYPPGFWYTPDFLTETEEAQLLAAVGRLHLNPFLFQGYEAKRRVASFGQDWSFEKRELKKGKDFPVDFAWLVEKVARNLLLEPAAFAELLVTEYPVGSVINWHRDAPPFDLIAGVSLAADCTFKLRPHDKARQTRKTTVLVPVRRRSLYVMQNEARSDWQHSIAPVHSLRYSVTLRTLK